MIYVADLVIHQDSGATTRMKAAGRVSAADRWGLTEEGNDFLRLWARDLQGDAPITVSLHKVQDEDGISQWEIHACVVEYAPGWMIGRKGEA